MPSSKFITRFGCGGLLRLPLQVSVLFLATFPLQAGQPSLELEAAPGDGSGANPGPWQVQDPGPEIDLELGLGSSQGPGQEPIQEPGQGSEQDPNVLLERRDFEQPDWAKDNFRRRDAGADGWESEVLHDMAKGKVKAWIHLLAAPKWHQDQLANLLGPSFKGMTPLRPEPSEDVKVLGGISVWRVSNPAAALVGSAGLRGLAEDLRRPYQGVEPHGFSKIVSVDLDLVGGFTTHVIGHLSGQTSERLVQQNFEWEIAWEIVPEEEVRMKSLKLLRFEEASSPGPLLADISGHVLQDLPFVESEILHGVGDYQNKADRLLRPAFVGAHGVAVGDVNGDGLDDIYLVQQGSLPNRLLLHQPDGKVIDGTVASGLGFLDATRSALILDMDNDGDQDLVVSVGADLVLAYNNGAGVFTKLLRMRGTGMEDIYSINSADPDQDGDLDLYAMRYATGGVMGSVPTPYHDANNGAANLYWRNDGPGQFTLATAEVGLDKVNGKFSLAGVWEDFDLDGDVDLYVANDFGRNNLFRNDGGYFTDIASDVGAEDIAAGMGATTADFDLDGDMDILVTNMFSSAGLRIVPQTDMFMEGENEDQHRHYLRHARGNTLLVNQGDGTFTDGTLQSGVAIGGWGWGSQFLDFNNDGLADIYNPNGFLTNKDPDDL